MIVVLVEYHGGEEPRVGIGSSDLNRRILFLDWQKVGDSENYARLSYNMLLTDPSDPLYPRAERAREMIVEIWPNLLDKDDGG